MVRLEETRALLLWAGWMISIPLWFDWKSVLTLITVRSCPISIPLWFDWKKNHLLNQDKTEIYFNSTMVRLEVSFRDLWADAPWYFNSTMVRLEVAKVLQKIINCPIFQFHYGSIGSLSWTATMIQTLNNFNSTMVRLEVLMLSMTWTAITYFNSTMVRLEAFSILAQAIAANAFQFHYGSIGRRRGKIKMLKSSPFQFHYGSIGSQARQRFLFSERTDFNSTMVRLEAVAIF